MSDIATFLLARLDEDEAAARANIGDGGLGDTEKTGPGWPDYQTYDNGQTAAAEAYLDQFRPLRMLREVGAKRAIVELESDRAVSDVADEVLLILAAVYAGHPDYRAEWKP